MRAGLFFSGTNPSPIIVYFALVILAALNNFSNGIFSLFFVFDVGVIFQRYMLFVKKGSAGAGDAGRRVNSRRVCGKVFR